MTQQEQAIISATAAHVQGIFTGEGSGHDWWHIWRVWNTARKLAQAEQANLYTVELAALLHDIADHKFHNGDDTVGPAMARGWLESLQVEEETIVAVALIISEVSFKGAGTSSAVSTLEAQVVQDADRLDAIGAIGIARAFAYGGHKGRELYDPAVAPVLHDSFEAYKKSSAPTINHFYEKLLLLKDRLHTSAAKREAAHRHTYMENFLQQFYQEWNGETI